MNNSSKPHHNQQETEIDSTSPPKGIKLPEPDTDNITVLTENLPNKPILPWNRYDSDWDEVKENDTESSDIESNDIESEEE